jgi:putative methyltransferase (TIGR04325 family)
MKQRLKKLIKSVAPSWYSAYIESRRKYGYFGEYKSWYEAKLQCIGYDSDIIIEKVKDSALKVKNGHIAYERDSVTFDKIDYSWPLLAVLLWIACKNNNSLNVLDFGGSLGTSYFQNKHFLGHLKLHWGVVEQEKFVNYGKKLFEDNELHFYKSAKECLSHSKPDIVLFSSSIQYLEEPYKVLADIISFQPPYIFFDTTPFLKTENDIISVQKVPPKIYEASYPVWIFSQEKFLSFFAKNKYHFIVDFNMQKVDIFKIKGKPVDLMGMFFAK